MKKLIISRIILVVAAALVFFMAAAIITVALVNRRNAKDNALELLNILEKVSVQGNFETDADFKKLVSFAVADIRITVIALDGSVISDSLAGDVSALENHLGRPEVSEAIAGGIGEDVRESGSFSGTRNLYLAKKIAAGGGEAVLRVAVVYNSITRVVFINLAVMALIFVLVLLVVFLTAPKLIKSIIAPVGMIKERLDNVGKSGEKKIRLTKYDDINRILLEVDRISEALDDSITEAKAEKETVKFIIENSMLAVIAVDKNNKVLFSNNKAKEYFDYDFDGRDLSLCVRDADFLSGAAAVMDTGAAVTYDFNDDKGRTSEIKMLPIESHAIRLIVTCEDVSSVRRLAKNKQDFFTNASHELNTPLSSVLGYAEILNKEKKYKPEFVEAIHTQALRMKSLIGDMLALSDLEERKEVQNEKLDLKSIAEEVLKSQLPAAEKKRIRLSLSAATVIKSVDREMITALISNLVDNAVKYTDGGGEVSVTLTKKALAVKDTGIGIAKEHLSRLCERFYRTDKGRSRAEGGTGLGLAIVKHICSYYNFILSIRSEEGAGTEVEVSF